ncbi:MAG: MmgE/PrpD family protein [Rhodospirillaceae bacterium]|nr:MmgE/PrpD family protein [Rhodospirillaceae bacterium]
MTTIAHRLAERIHAVSWDDLPEEAIHWAKIGILDTIAVTLAGATEECTRIALATPGVAEAPGPALIYGHEQRTSVLDAALINGVASHALDFDDVNNHIGGHPSVPLVPAIMALGDWLDVSGRDALLAYVTGFEVETRIGRGVNQHHYEKGWHPTATLGIFGTVAAASRLLGLGLDQTATALGLAVSLSSGVKANFGTMTKPLHIGHSVRNGLFAALLARDGFTANQGAFEHHQGFLKVFNGDGTHDMERTFAEWGQPWNVAQPGPNLKQFPCCGSTHGAINAMLRLRAEHGLQPDDVADIEVLTTPRRLPHTDNPNPRTGLEAKFSIHYVTARALSDGAVKLAHFDGQAFDDDVPRAIMGKVRTGIHPDMNDPDHDGYGAEVIVTTKDERELRHRVDTEVLRGPEYPMTELEFAGKFTDCVSRALPENGVEALYSMLQGLDVVESLRSVSDFIAGDTSATQAAE